MHSKIFAAAALAAAAMLIGPAAQAAPIPLYNTGVDAAGVPLPDGTGTDPHYSLPVVPFGSTNVFLVRTSAGGYPIPPYIGDDALSAWIGPHNDSFLDGPTGAYDYQVSFSLAGLNPATASITGLWATDNEGLDIRINGLSTGQTNSIQFVGFTPFSITSGFQAGLNTLDFIVNNDGGPTALRVEMTGTASPTGVPEPAAWALMLLGFGGLGVALRASREKASAAA